MTSTSSEFQQALARLDAEIQEAEQRLSDLRLKRKGAEAFLSYMDVAAPKAPRVHLVQVAGVGGPTDAVFAAMKPDVVYDVDSAMKAVNAGGAGLTREQVRNAIHYLVRKEAITRLARGTWRKDSETPGASGVSAGGPSEEGGDSRETTSTSAAESDNHPQLGASITEAAV